MIYLKRVDKKDEWFFDSFTRFKIILCISKQSLVNTLSKSWLRHDRDGKQSCMSTASWYSWQSRDNGEINKV